MKGHTNLIDVICYCDSPKENAHSEASENIKPERCLLSVVP